MKPSRAELSHRVVAAALVLAALVVACPRAGRAEAAASGLRGFSPDGLAKVGDYIRNEIATGKIPGAILLIQQHGKPVYYETFGLRDIATKSPMTKDAIFRLYSMSKPITSVAAMMLVEDGSLSLDDPVSKYIPAFADIKVGIETSGEKGSLAFEPLKRPVTILDLLRHTSGIPYGWHGDSQVRAAYADANLRRNDADNADFVTRIAKLPLAEQPGTRWDYGYSTDVLGRVIEVISGKSLFQFERERLLGPLGMTETAFFVADPAKRSRIAEPLPHDRAINPTTQMRDPIQPRIWESGGGGMVGTIADYARFAQMRNVRGTTLSADGNGGADGVGPYRAGDEHRA